MTYLLDASALLAYVLQEPGQGFVVSLLDQRLKMTTVNFTEALLKLKRKQQPGTNVLDLVDQIKFDLIPYTEEIARLTARQNWPNKPSLSLGDKICLATGIALDYQVVTADREWAKVKLPVKVMTIR